MDEIRLPKGMKKILKQLQEKDRTAYLCGAGIREAAAEKKVPQWNVYTNADQTLLSSLFPEGKMEADGSFRLENCGPEASEKDSPVYFRVLSGTIEAFLEGRLMTADAFAWDGSAATDPYGGLEDAFSEQVRTVRDSEELLKESPHHILDLIEFSAQTGFSIPEKLKSVIARHSQEAKQIDKAELTRWFTDLLTAPYAGSGLRYIRDCKLLSCIIGDRIERTMNKNEKKAMDMYINKIDATLPILERRLTVFYLGFLRKRDYIAMDYLKYSDHLREREAFAHRHLSDLHFINKKRQLKHMIYEYGYDNYQYLENIAKIQARIYDLDTKGIFARYGIVQEVARDNEAVFQEDLAIKKEDIIAAGIVKDEKRAEEIFALLPFYIHRWPKFNTKEILLDQSKKINRNIWKEMKLKHAFFRR